MPSVATIAAKLKKLPARKKAALADLLWRWSEMEEDATKEGIRRLEDLVSGKVRGLTEKQFRRSLRAKSL
jgi:hypothetical protein